jgi:O-antigen/teichoic acid export membrane protein
LRQLPPGSVVAGQRIWQAVAGLLTAGLVVHALTPEQQGWYYGLVNAAAMFTLFDLGLSLILVQRSAALQTEVASSSLEDTCGKQAERFTQLVAFGRSWYRRASLLFVLILLPGGLFFFASVPSVSAPPFWPLLWLLLLASAATNLWLLPFMSFIEGRGQIVAVYGLRLVQGIVGSLMCWALLMAGGGAWASLGVPMAAAVLGLAWLRNRNSALLRLGFGGDGACWRADVWPQQWRLGLSWISGFLLTQIYVPLLLRLDGPASAGQMGLTLAIANMLALVSQSWLTSAYPRMAMHAARGEWQVLGRTFRRAILLSTGFYIVGVLALFVTMALPATYEYKARLLPGLSLLGLLAAIFVSHLCAALAMYVRTAGREPFVWISVTSALLTLIGALAVIGSHGVAGLVSVMLGVQLLLALPLCVWLWQSERKLLESA